MRSIPGHGAIALREGFEDGVMLVRGNADPRVANREAQLERIVGRDGGATQLDVAAFGEFHGVAQEIEQDLTQPLRVAHHGARHVLLDVEEHRNGQLFEMDDDRADRLGDQRARVEHDRLDRHPIGFDACVVQHVVQQAEQRTGRLFQYPEIAVLLCGESAVEQELGHAEHAM